MPGSLSHIRGSAKPRPTLQTVGMANAMNMTPISENDHGKTEQVALQDLLEVEACLRDMLQSTTDPTVLQRLYNLHREIQKYVAEINSRKS
jgi:hypothetical protein